MRNNVSLYARIKVKYVKMILKGVKMIEEREKYEYFIKFMFQNLNYYGVDLIGPRITDNYNKYKLWMILVFSIYAFCYIKHNFNQTEFSSREKPNILIPKSVYKVRRKSYIYWELSRMARGFKKTFSYYNYDKESVGIVNL